MLDFCQKGGIGKWIIVISVIAVIVFIIHRHKQQNQEKK